MIRNAVARVKRYESLMNIRNQGGTAEFSSLARGVFLLSKKLCFLDNKKTPPDRVAYHYILEHYKTNLRNRRTNHERKTGAD